MSAADVPLFASTEAAESYGRSLTLMTFPALIRTYFTTQVAIANVPDGALDRKAMLALRSQHLREAAQEFLAIIAPALCREPTAPYIISAEALRDLPSGAGYTGQSDARTVQPSVSPFAQWHGIEAPEPNDEIGAS